MKTTLNKIRAHSPCKSGWKKLLSKQEQDIERAYSTGLAEGERLAIEQEPQQEPMKLVEQHWSDCAVHNAPAYPKGDCTCGVSASSLAPHPIIGLQAVHDAITVNPSLAEEPGAAEEEDAYRKQWVGLTDEELMDMMGYGKQYGHIPQYARNFVDAIEDKLKEKNHD